ncbi:Transcription factor Spi-C, partial [Nibea albiflora]
QESQSDLEVILEFLEEYYKQNAGENVDKVYWTADGEPYEQHWMCYEPPVSNETFQNTCFEAVLLTAFSPSSSQNIKPALQPLLAHDAPPALSHNTTETLCERGPLPNFVSTRLPTKHPTTTAGSGEKVRLFHFLFEMLEDPNMAHCVSWVPADAGVFRFSSTNKDQVAALWGQRKGNKRPMTYQKMSRALRNYSRSGEIFKVKKKLTYQFSRDTLMSLQKCHRRSS